MIVNEENDAEYKYGHCRSRCESPVGIETVRKILSIELFRNGN
jgi:hypothetical protein